MKKKFPFLVCGVACLFGFCCFGSAGTKDMNFIPVFRPEKCMKIISKIRENIDYQKKIADDATKSEVDRNAASKVLRDLIGREEEFAERLREFAYGKE